MIRNVLKELWPYLALGAAVVLFPQVTSSHYVLLVGALIGLYSLITLGLCLLLGYAGQVSLGQAAFYGIGAYTSAILTTKAGVNPWLGILAGMALAATVAYLVGRPTLRLHSHYLAMATLGFGMIVQVVFHEWRSLTGGFGGIPAIPRLSVGEFEIQGDVMHFYLIWGVVILALALSVNIVNSRVGRAMRAIHDSEVAALASGVDVARYKVKVFVVSAVFASVAGSLYAHYISFVSPDPFGLAFSVLLLVMVIVGGVRHIWGALLGAALMTAMGQQIEKTPTVEHYNIAAYGLMLMLFVIFMPDGVAGLLQKGWQRVSGIVRRGGNG